MRQVVIENPILNSPFAEPSRHFRFDDTFLIVTHVTLDSGLEAKFAQTLEEMPAVNNHGRFGRWDFKEIEDPWDFGDFLF